MSKNTAPDQAKLQELDAFIQALNLTGRDTAGRRAVLIQVLHRAQGIFGWLPEAAQKHIAAKLDLHVSEVYGVVTFYHFFKTKPSGRHNIDFCTGTACFVRGIGKVIEQVEAQTGTKLGETSADGRFTLGSLRCVGACSLAPVMQINGKTYGRVAPEQVEKILSEYK
jgi:NADH-quinone oxidoreductase E subunit